MYDAAPIDLGTANRMLLSLSQVRAKWTVSLSINKEHILFRIPLHYHLT